MREQPLAEASVRVHRLAEQRVPEVERQARREDVRRDEGIECMRHLRFVEPGQGGCMSDLGASAEHSDGMRHADSRRPESRKAHQHVAGDRVGKEASHPACGSRVRWHPVCEQRSR
jgi:hypothetical protein